MKIRTKHPLPSTKALKAYLDTKLSNRSARLFGLGSDKTLLVKKSAFIGVQITRRDHELVIEGSLPSISSSILSGFLMLEGIFYLFEFIFQKQWKKMELEVAQAISEQYH